MIKKKSVFVLAAILIIAFAFSGCAARKPMTTTDQTDQFGGQRTGYNYNDREDTNYGSVTGIEKNLDNRYNMGDYRGLGNNYGIGSNTRYGRAEDRYSGGSNNSANYRIPGLGTQMTAADNIARAVETVPGVQNATVVVSGNTAYVGINTTATGLGTTGTANLTDIKRKVAQTVRNTDDNITTVYVSADANFRDRLRRVGNGVREGRPIDGFRTELTELVRRLTPERQ